MPNFIAEAVSVTITAATASALTCADTSGLYVGQRGWIVDSGGSNNLEIIVVNVADSTHFSCQKLSSIGNSGNADLSSYNGGTCYFEKQLVEVPGGGADLGTLDTIAVGKVPAKTDTGFANATTANVPDSTDKRYVTDDESDTVGDLTAQQADGQTDLVTPATRAAAEALAAGAPVITFASLIAEMCDRDCLARFPSPEYSAKQASSYNRASTARDQADQTWTGWHKDSDGVGYIRTETINGATEYVVMEHAGPGAIVRMWAPFFYNSYGVRVGPRVKIYLDGSTTPVIEQSWIELLTSLAWPGSYGGKPDSVNTIALPVPFANFTARAGVLHLPIPFAQSCKVTMDAAPFYNTIGYRAYEEGTQVRSFTLDDLGSLALSDTADTLIASADFSGGTLTQGSGPVAASGTLSIDLPDGPAAVKHLEITLDAAAVAADPSILRSTVIRATWDGEATVWCPVGDFFGSSDRLNDLATYVRTTVASTGKLTCRWVMPYKATGNISIINYGSAALNVAVDVRTDRWIWDERSMHFSAGWMPDRVEHGDTPVDMTFVDVTGKGVLVGDGMTALNLLAKWWGEGDERIYSSATQYLTDKFPGIHGTGTEDYYGWAGGVEPQLLDEFSTAFEANVQVGSQTEDSTLGHNVCTRTRFLDAVPFADRLVFDMEAAAGVDQRHSYDLIAYSAATMFYARPGATSSRGAQATAAARPITQLASLTAKKAYLQSAGTKRLWRLGEDDAGAAAGGAGNATTAEAGGVLNLVKVGSPTYSADTANGGSSLAISFPGDAAYTLGDSGLFTGLNWTDFELSFDCKPTDMTSYRIAVCIGRYTDGAIFVYHTSNTWRVYRAGVSDIITGGASTAKANKWQTVAIKRVAGTLTLYVDGVSLGNTSAWSNPANYLTIGAARTLVDALDGPFVGLVDDVKIFGL